MIQEKISQNNSKHSVLQPFLDAISKNVELADVLFILAEIVLIMGISIVAAINMVQNLLVKNMC